MECGWWIGEPEYDTRLAYDATVGTTLMSSDVLRYCRQGRTASRG